MRRLYSLFEVDEVNGRKRYTRISPTALTKPVAVRHFQNALLAPYTSAKPMKVRELRPVKDLTPTWGGK